MEGFGYNPIVYDFVTDMTWRGEVPPLDDWAGEFVHRRYGRRVPRAEEAWDVLRRTVYRQPGNPGSILCARPAIGKPCTIGYDSLGLLEAWEKLAACADELGAVDTYRFDLVHLARQALSNLGEVLYADVVDAYQAKDPRALAEANRRLLELIGDLDQLLATREDFLLGRWLEDAKRWATNDEEKRLYEHNARTIITLWGPPDGVLHEYAQRQWSGLLRGFYRPRWEMFLARLEKSLAEGKPLDAAAWEKDIRRWEDEWTRKTESYPTAVEGEPIETSRWLLAKHQGVPQGIRARRGEPNHGQADELLFVAAGVSRRLAADGRRRDTDRYWATDVGQDESPWWQVDLQRPTKVGRVVVVLYYGDDRHYGFTVETSPDGKTWDTVADRRDNTERSTRAGHACRFAPRDVRFIRVRVPHNSANTGRHLVEVMAYEQ